MLKIEFIRFCGIILRVGYFFFFKKEVSSLVYCFFYISFVQEFIINKILRMKKKSDIQVLCLIYKFFNFWFQKFSFFIEQKGLYRNFFQKISSVYYIFQEQQVLIRICSFNESFQNNQLRYFVGFIQCLNRFVLYSILFLYFLEFYFICSLFIFGRVDYCN